MQKTNLREEIHAWIKTDAPLSVKMALQPAHVDGLLSRLLPILTAAHARGFREGIEAAAKVAEQHAHDAVTIDTLIAGSIASAIRALPPPGQGEA